MQSSPCEVCLWMILASSKVLALHCALFVRMIVSLCVRLVHTTIPHQVRYSRHMDILTAAGFLVMLQAIRRLYAPGLEEAYAQRNFLRCLSRFLFVFGHHV